MADGYARATGKPGLCMAQTVGAANLAAGLRDAWLGCAPVVAITGGPYPGTRSRHTYQEIDDLPLFKPVTKFSTRIESVDRFPDMLRQAFRSATTGKPGPVHLEVSGHFGEIESDEGDLGNLVESRFAQVPAFRPGPEPDAVRAAAAALAAAERPVIVAGGGVRHSGAGAELLALAEALGIPVATSLNAKDMVPSGHPLSVGVVGNYSRRSANRTVLEADLVFFVGSQTSSQLTCLWRVPRAGTPVIQLDIDPAELGRHYPNQVSLLGDAKVTLAALAEAADRTSAGRRAAWRERTAGYVQEWRAGLADLFASDAVPLRPERICAELSDLLPEDAILVSDTGHAGMWTGGMVDLQHPGQGFIRCAGSLGWGLPAAIGAKLAVGERPVVLFTGDGGFWYHVGELETAVRWNVGAVLVVNNNRSLNQGQQPYEAAYGGKLRGKHADLWHHEDVNFAKLAESMGATGIRVERPGEFPAALARALETPGPTVIDVVTDIDAMAPLAYLG
jgi:acetolactate synthase-1/2/3 large subunit